MIGDLFLAYVRQQLATTLGRGAVVALETWLATSVAEAIAAVGARLLNLPPFCPDLNQFELAFSKPMTMIPDARKRRLAAQLRLLGRFVEEFTDQ